MSVNTHFAKRPDTSLRLQRSTKRMPPPSAPLVLTYFDDNKGRNELVRLIFVVGEASRPAE